MNQLCNRATRKRGDRKKVLTHLCMGSLQVSRLGRYPVDKFLLSKPFHLLSPEFAFPGSEGRGGNPHPGLLPQPPPSSRAGCGLWFRQWGSDRQHPPLSERRQDEWGLSQGDGGGQMGSEPGPMCPHHPLMPVHLPWAACQPRLQNCVPMSMQVLNTELKVRR